MPPEDCGALARLALAVVEVTFRCRTCEPDCLDGIDLGDLLPAPTEVELGAEEACEGRERELVSEHTRKSRPVAICEVAIGEKVNKDGHYHCCCIGVNVGWI